MKIAQVILPFVPLGCVHGTEYRPVSSGSGSSLVPSWMQLQEEREDRSLAVITAGRNLQMLVKYDWECRQEGPDVICTWTQLLEDFQNKNTSKIEATLRCPDSPASAVDFRSAKNCECYAEVTPNPEVSDLTHECNCFVCSDERSPDVLTVDCETEIETNMIVSECKNLDCNHICNGFCTDACPPEALADPQCVTCPRPTESPTSSSRPTAEPTTGPPVVAPGTGTPTGGFPTSTPTSSQLPTPPPITPTADTETSIPTSVPAPTVVDVTASPTGPTVAPVDVNPTPSVSEPTISPKPSVSGEVALGSFVVDFDASDDPDQEGILSAALKEYLREELQTDHPNLVDFTIEVLNAGSGTVEFQAHGVFQEGEPIPPMDELIQSQRNTVENMAQYAEFIANGNAEFTKVVVREMNAEGPVPRGQRAVG